METEEIFKNLRINILKRKNHITVAAAESREAEIADIICDGVNDEEDVKQAIYDLPRGGGIVELLDGEFIPSTPISWEKDNVFLRGQGAGDRKGAYTDDTLAVGTRIIASPNFSGSAIIDIARLDRPVAHTKLFDFTVDGNKIPGITNGINILSFRNTISGVHIFDCPGHGLYVSGLQDWNPYDCFYNSLLLGYNGLDGIHFPQYSPDSHAMEIISFLNGGNGVYLRGASHQFTSLHTYGNRKNGVCVVGGSARNKIINWKCEQNWEHGLFLDGSNGGIVDLEVVAANFKNNGLGSDNTYDHVHAKSAVIRTNLSTINIASTSPGRHARFAVNLSDPMVEDSIILGLQINPGGETYKTKAINDLGKRTSIENVGVNAGNPNVTGHWKGRGKEGISVLDTLSNKIYKFVRGSWYQLN